MSASGVSQDSPCPRATMAASAVDQGLQNQQTDGDPLHLRTPRVRGPRHQSGQTGPPEVILGPRAVPHDPRSIASPTASGHARRVDSPAV